MIGQTVGRYRVVEKLGEGGMGVVYRAEDTRLHRTVALKFLAPALVGSPEEQRRLANEARTAASINHPNICTIYEIDEHEGRTFIAMEYVEGSTLRDRVLSDEIGVAEALRYGIQIAKGLAEAHARGVVHRDIKSANIMINTAGQAVIMDFGLARSEGQVRPDERFSSGGTSAYMSPEQARGEPVDQRTDIWSVGVVLYEMLAGELPFRGDYEQAVVYSIINEPPMDLREARPGVPGAVVDIVCCALEKEPDARYQSLDAFVAAVGAALDDLSGARGGVRRAGPVRRAAAWVAAAAVLLAAGFSGYRALRVGEAGSIVRVPIAVSDFDNSTGDPTLDGLSGMLITALEQSDRLSVVTRSRMLDLLKQTGRKDVGRIDESLGQEISRVAGAQALVIPGVRRFGDLYTIDLKVLDVTANRYVFTGREEGQGLESVPRMIDALAGRIRVDLDEPPETVEQAPPVAAVTTSDLEAYRAYFDGETAIAHLKFDDAAAAFERAVAIDSTFALAHYRLAYVAWWSRQKADLAGRHVARALALADRLPGKERYLVRALSAGINQSFDAQIPIYGEMRGRYPNDKEMLFGLGDAYFHTGAVDSARVYFGKVLDADPRFERALQHMTWLEMRGGQDDAGLAMANRWLEVSGSLEAMRWVAAGEIRKGNVARARALVDSVRAIDPDAPGLDITLAQVRLASGETPGAIEALERASHSKLWSVSAGAMGALGGAVYPYTGRFHDAVTIADSAIARVSAHGDTSRMAGLMLQRAFVQFWRTQDPSMVAQAAASVAGLPAEALKSANWQSLAAAWCVSGDSVRANEVWEKYCGDASPEEVAAFRILGFAMSGRCAEAAARLATEKAGSGWSESSMRVITASCQIKEGNFAGAAEMLGPVVSNTSVTFRNAGVIPVAHYFLGLAYEGLGRAAAAKTEYETLLALWKDGDRDHAWRIDTEGRLARLRGAGSM